MVKLKSFNRFYSYCQFNENVLLEVRTSGNVTFNSIPFYHNLYSTLKNICISISKVLRKVHSGFKKNIIWDLDKCFGFFTEYFHSYLLYFHLLKDQKTRSISNRGHNQKSFSICNSKSYKMVVLSVKSTFWYQFGVFLLQLHFTHYTGKIVTPFFLPKILFSNFEMSTKIFKTKIWLYFPQSFINKYIHTYCNMYQSRIAVCM